MASIEAEREQFQINMLWRDKRWRGVTIQIVVLALLFAATFGLITNLLANLEAIGVELGFGFLAQPSMYDINQALIEYDSTMSHGRAALVGLINTALVAALGILGCTVLGFAMGVGRLSSNWLLRNTIYCFVEFTRNVPLLVQILLWWGIIVNLPRTPFVLAEGFYVSNRGIYFPKPVFEDGMGVVAIALVAAVAGAIAFARWAKGVQMRTGRRYPVGWISTGIVLGLPLLVYLAMGAPTSLEYGRATRFNIVDGGRVTPEFFALWLALTLYTAAFVSEIVRSGILSVSKGQTEAAFALGIKPNWTMRLIILPQALRVIVPPLTSQYLNLTKNSSLAIAIGYMDITATLGGITLNQTGQALECVLLLMGVYLSFSLSISAFMNWYNHRIKLVER